MSEQITNGGRVSDAMVERAFQAMDAFFKAGDIHYGDGLSDDDKSFACEGLRAALEAALTAPTSVVPDVRRDAEKWGVALNEAAWTFIDVCPEKSALLFNTAKTALRASILKYLDVLAAREVQS